jgi:hypothetical protein
MKNALILQHKTKSKLIKKTEMIKQMLFMKLKLYGNANNNKT